MPPLPQWFAGRQAVVRFLAANAFASPGGFRLVPVAANGQAAFGVYQRQPDSTYHFHGVQMPTVTATGIARIVTFLDSNLYRPFGLPPQHDATAPGATISGDSAGL